MRTLVAIALCLFSAATILTANESAKGEGHLRVPTEVVAEFVPGKTNYTIVYVVTNTANAPVPIAGYTASCQCMRVETTDYTVPANGQIQIRTTIAQEGPTLQYVVLQDAATNSYQTILWIRPSTK